MRNRRQQALFQFLRSAEANKRSFTIEEVADASSLSEDSIRTYFSKKLKDRWVFDENGRWESRGMLNMTELQFANIMTQKLISAPESPEGYAEWRKQLEQLILHGVCEGFPVADTLLELAASIDDPNNG